MLFARFPDWPRFDWKCPASKVDLWLEERVFEVAALTRRFELAFTVLAEEGQLDLGAVDHALIDWDRRAHEIMTYTTWGDSRRVPTARAFARPLEKITDSIRKGRQKVLGAFRPEEAELVLAREEELLLDAKALRPPSVAPVPATLAHFTGELAAFSATEGFQALDTQKLAPVTAEEVLKRTQAESKALPESRQLGALLAILPSEWVSATFDELQLELDEELELTTGTRATAKRGAIFKHLKHLANLQALASKLSREEVELLADLMAHDSWLPYRKLRDAYGLDESDGFYWNARKPAGTLSKLRRKALAFVGTRNGTAMVTVPLDLSAALHRLLSNRAAK